MPGQFISIPNDYQYSRGDNVTIDIEDNIGTITNLSRSDLYGVDRREIIVYDVQIGKNNNTTDVYISNEDGKLVGVDNSVYIDDIYINGTVIKGEDIPLAPDYMKIGSFTFEDSNNAFDKLFTLIIFVLIAVFVAILFFVVYKFVRFIKNKFMR